MLTMQSGKSSAGNLGGVGLEPSPTLERLGFATGGAISSRTAMLNELQILLDAVPQQANKADYQLAVEFENVLGKASSSNRSKTYKFLNSLYGLDLTYPTFRNFRAMYAIAKTDRPLLIALLAMSRESILRACLGKVLHCQVGRSLGRQDFENWIRQYAPGRYSESMYLSFSHNLYASFFQFGYLGKSAKKARLRVHPEVSVPSVAFAAFLDWLCGGNGMALLEGEYSKALDLSQEDHLAMLAAAGRQGLMRVAYSGGVLDLDFSGWLKGHEKRLNV